MLMLSLFRFVAAVIPWVVNLTTWLLARSLNMPQPLVHDTGVFVFVQVQTIENRVFAGLCPMRLRRQLRPLLQRGSLSRPKSASKRRTAMIHPSTFLSRALLADAIFSGVSAVGLTLGAGMLAPFLNLPESLLRETGLFLIAYTALVGWLASRSSVPKALVLLVIVGNAAWTLGSFALLFSGAVSPNLLGQLVTVAQAIATGVFAELQYVGLRKSGGVVTA